MYKNVLTLTILSCFGFLKSICSKFFRAETGLPNAGGAASSSADLNPPRSSKWQEKIFGPDGGIPIPEGSQQSFVIDDCVFFISRKKRAAKIEFVDYHGEGDPREFEIISLEGKRAPLTLGGGPIDINTSSKFCLW